MEQKQPQSHPEMALEKKAEGTIQLKRFQNEMDPQSPRIIEPLPPN